MREPTGNTPHPLPAVGEAEPGTVLADFDLARAERQAKLKAARAARRKALVARGTAMVRAINCGKLNPRSIKSEPPRWPEAYQREVAALRAERWEDWQAGRVQPSSVRRIDFIPRTGVYVSQNRRRGGPWSEPRVIAVGRPEPRTAVAALRSPRADRARREGPARIAGRGGDGGDSAAGDLAGDSDPPLPRKAGCIDYRSPEERFWAKVDLTLGCWLWMGGVNRDGYGHIRGYENRRIGVHRFAYELLVGSIPEGLEIDHLCRVRRCVNPEHLEPVPHRVNVLRGQAPSSANAHKTHCVHGHEFTPENTYVEPSNGYRKCRTCHLQQQRERLGRQ